MSSSSTRSRSACSPSPTPSMGASCTKPATARRRLTICRSSSRAGGPEREREFRASGDVYSWKGAHPPARPPRSPGDARALGRRGGLLPVGDGAVSDVSSGFRPKPSGKKPPAVGWIARRIPGATGWIPGAPTFSTIPIGRARPARPRAAAIRQMATACSTWPAMRGSGSTTGTIPLSTACPLNETRSALRVDNRGSFAAAGGRRLSRQC